MTRFAAKTEVPVEKTQAEIQAVVRRYKADGFVTGWEDRQALVRFRSQGRYVRLTMTLPDPADEAFTTYLQGSVKFSRAASEAHKRWDQACRQRWRAMLLLIKAKLEAVESGIVTFEQEFFSHVVMPDGGTVYEHARGAVAIAYEKGEAPALLPQVRGSRR